MEAKPLYSSRDYEEYCQQQKDKGLLKCYWEILPAMWEEELAFRRELEEALDKAVIGGKIKIKDL